MLEILLFLRGILRFICKAGLVLFGAALLVGDLDMKMKITSIIMIIANVLILIYYDRMLFRMAEKRGISLIL